MELLTTIPIDASPARVWQLWTDVERWPEWTASVTRIEALDGPVRVGARFRITQPRFPVLVWEVTACDEGRSWTWVTRSPGAVTAAHHRVRPDGSGTVVEQHLVQEGWVGAPIGWLIQGLSRRYLGLEGDGLKRLSETPAP